MLHLLFWFETQNKPKKIGSNWFGLVSTQVETPKKTHTNKGDWLCVRSAKQINKHSNHRPDPMVKVQEVRCVCGGLAEGVTCSCPILDLPHSLVQQ